MTTTPISPALLQHINTLTTEQKQWLADYCLTAIQTASKQSTGQEDEKEITILAASQTGNAWRTAKALSGIMKEKNIAHRLIRACAYTPEDLSQEKTVFFVLSTYGSGGAPEEAEPLFQFLFVNNPPALVDLSYAVLGLGDSSYTDFCGFAQMVDERLEEQGAKRLLPLQKCDTDYAKDSAQWFDAVLSLYHNHIDTTKPIVDTEDPCFTGSLKSRTELNQIQSDKNTAHLLLQVDDANFRYQPGDSLAIYCHNDKDMIAEILHYCQLTGDEILTNKGISLRQALYEQCDITRNHPALVQRYAQITGNTQLEALCHDTDKLQQYLQNTPVIGLMANHPCPMSAEDLYSLFRPLQPRYYSIASSQKQHANQVALTVGIKHFQHHGKTYSGSASGYLGNTLQMDEEVRFFIAENPAFRLPENPNTPIIMIAAGTGIAPFRAFLQERAADKAKGKNWLIFGNRHPEEDLYYQQEWQQYQESGLLTRFDFVASRAQAEKEYVHHRLCQQAALFWQWLQEGAVVYLCGSEQRLAASVQAAILQIIAEQKQIDPQSAKQYLSQLKNKKRYLKDVY